MSNSKRIDLDTLEQSNGLSDLLSAMNVNYDKDFANRGEQFTPTEAFDYYWDYYSTQDERAYNEYYYNTYESPSAMVSQYEEAGLNPALMYGSNATSTSNNSTGYTEPNEGHGQSQNFKSQLLLGLVDILGQASDLSSQIETRRTEQYANKRNADANYLSAMSSMFEAQTNRKRQVSDEGLTSSKTTWQNLQNEYFKDTTGIQKQALELQNALVAGEISLNQSQEQLNDIRSQLSSANISKVNAETQLTLAQKGLTLASIRMTNLQGDYQEIANNIAETCKPAVIQKTFAESNMTNWEALVKKLETQWKLSFNADQKRMIQIIWESDLTKSYYEGVSSRYHAINGAQRTSGVVRTMEYVIPILGQCLTAGILSSGNSYSNAGAYSYTNSY